MEEEKKRRKNPTLALILSAVFPGLGQIYNNQVPKGVIFLVLNTIINFLLYEPLQRVFEAKGGMPDRPTLIVVSGYTIAGMVLWLFSIIDAKKTAEMINRGKVT